MTRLVGVQSPKKKNDEASKSIVAFVSFPVSKLSSFLNGKHDRALIETVSPPSHLRHASGSALSLYLHRVQIGLGKMSLHQRIHTRIQPLKNNERPDMWQVTMPRKSFKYLEKQ